MQQYRLIGATLEKYLHSRPYEQSGVSTPKQPACLTLAINQAGAGFNEVILTLPYEVAHELADFIKQYVPTETPPPLTSFPIRRVLK